MAVVSIKQFWLSNEFAGMLITLESLRISLMFIFCLTWCTYTCALTQHMKPFPEFDGVFVSSLICVKKTKPTSSVSKLGVETFHQIVPQFSFYLGQKVVLHMLVQKCGVLVFSTENHGISSRNPGSAAGRSRNTSMVLQHSFCHESYSITQVNPDPSCREKLSIYWFFYFSLSFYTFTLQKNIL